MLQYKDFALSLLVRNLPSVYFETTVSMDNEVIYLHLLPYTFLGSVNIFRKKRETKFFLLTVFFLPWGEI